MQIQQLKTKVRNRVWKLLNNLRRPYPGARKAMPFDASLPEEGVAMLWKGPPPEAQMLEHPSDFLNVGMLEFTAPFVLSIRNGSVVGKRGDVVTPEGTVFTEVSPEIPRREHHHFLLERGNLPKPQRIGGSVAVLNCGPYRNYFHFLFDAISRLHLYRQAKVRADYYCVAQDMPFQQELVTRLGIKTDQILPLEKGTHLVAENLIVSSLPGYNKVEEQVHLKDRDTYQFVREAILSQIDQAPGAYASRIYIQRTTRRTVANEEEVLEKLQTLGEWKIVRLEDYSVLEQAAMIYHAQAVVGLHGAGLANLIYAQPNTQVVEIFSPILIEPIFFQIATLFGLRYHPVIAKHTDSSTLPQNGSEAVWVDPEDIIRCF